AGAGNSVRLIKLLLKRAGIRVFFDADDLLSLDTLFDAVNKSRYLFLILSGETSPSSLLIPLSLTGDPPSMLLLTST
ncbi:MAG: hypothetical protein SGPRY_004755, partial [Prymnesium sp.]